MKAVVVESFGQPPLVRDVPLPVVGPTDVLVRVHASSINPADASIANGELRSIVEHVLPITLGRDFAGVVEAVGADVTEFRAGDAVLGNLPPWNPAVHDGAWSEYVLLPGGQFATHLPDGVPMSTAGVASLVTITALEAVDTAELSPGQTVLIVGAAGGIGVVAVQLARVAGATVIALASEEDAGFLADLGASRTIDRDADLTDALHGGTVDVLIDLISPDTAALDALAAHVREGGRIISARRAAGDGDDRFNVSAFPTARLMGRLAETLKSGIVRYPLQAVHEFGDLPGVLKEFESSHKRGKHGVAFQVG